MVQRIVQMRRLRDGRGITFLQTERNAKLRVPEDLRFTSTVATGGTGSESLQNQVLRTHAPL